MTKKKVYIAGKVTGLDYKDVYLKFQTAQLKLEACGFEVYNPLHHVDEDCDWNLAMKICLKALIDCDYIHLLHDWNESAGATIEKELADKLQIEKIEFKN